MSGGRLISSIPSKICCRQFCILRKVNFYAEAQFRRSFLSQDVILCETVLVYATPGTCMPPQGLGCHPRDLDATPGTWMPPQGLDSTPGTCMLPQGLVFHPMTCIPPQGHVLHPRGFFADTHVFLPSN